MIDLTTLQYLHPKVAYALSDFFRAIGDIDTEGKPTRTDDATLAEVKDKIEAIIQARLEPQFEVAAVPSPPPAAPLPPVDAAADAVPSPPPAAPLPPVDAAGLPWDGRIHSSSKAILQDGTWRQKRGVDPAVLASVTAELTAAQAAPPVPSVPLPPPFVASAVPSAPLIITSPPAESVGVAMTASPSEGPITFPQLMRKITEGILSRAIDQSHVTAACAAVGLPSIISLKDRPDLVAAVAAALGVAS